MLAACVALGACALVHRLPGLSLRAVAYLVLMMMVVAMWMKFGGGIATMRLVLRSRVDAWIAGE